MYYTHLSQKERVSLFDLLQLGYTKTAIAKLLHRDKSTITREIQRNATSTNRAHNNSPKKVKHYLPDTAQKKYDYRRSHAKTPYPLKSYFIYRYVITHLRLGWSPEQISGRLRLEYEELISYECIYQFIYSPRAAHLHLCSYLPRRHCKRRKHTGRKTRRVLIHNRIDISLRPIEVLTRERFGDYEGDTIFGLGSGPALATINERKSRYVFIRKLPRKTAQHMTRAVIASLQLTSGLRTITFDNGSENSHHEQITSALDIPVYFARPYHSWERGSNERVNGLVRRFYPKKTNFKNVSSTDIQCVQDLINHRPLKCLGWKTPAEVFHSYQSSLPSTVALDS